MTNTAANLPPRANCVHDCRKLSTSLNYHCSHGASAVSTVQWPQCTEHSGPSGESRSEMSKTAVLIVSLTWKLGRRGPLDCGKWAVQVVRVVQEQIQKQVQTSGDTSTSTRASAKL